MFFFFVVLQCHILPVSPFSVGLEKTIRQKAVVAGTISLFFYFLTNICHLHILNSPDVEECLTLILNQTQPPVAHQLRRVCELSRGKVSTIWLLFSICIWHFISWDLDWFRAWRVTSWHFQIIHSPLNGRNKRLLALKLIPLSTHNNWKR